LLWGCRTTGIVDAGQRLVMATARSDEVEDAVGNAPLHFALPTLAWVDPPGIAVMVSGWLALDKEKRVAN
jgi:hypothetical protein